MQTRTREAVEHLAASPEAQAEYLKQLGVAPSCDELGLELEDALLSEHPRPPLTGKLLDELNEELSKMSGAEHAGLWELDALQREEWEQIRVMARKILELQK